MSDKVLTVAEEAIANADAYLNNAVLPTYSEVMAALKSCLAAMNEAGKPRLLTAWRDARDIPARFDATMAGDFRFKG